VAGMVGMDYADAVVLGGKPETTGTGAFGVSA
jgi:hypothetical protein